MKTTKLVEIPARIEERTDKTTCDLCGNECSDRRIRHYDTVELKRETGDNWPEGGSATITEFDVCPGCWEAKLVPWLESQGAKPKVREVEF